MPAKTPVALSALVLLSACGIDAVGRFARDEDPSLPGAPASAGAGAGSAAEDLPAPAPPSGDASSAVPVCAELALSFDGVDDYASVPHREALDLSGDFTVEAWIRPGPRAAGPDPMHVVSLHDPFASRGWSLLVRAGRVEMVVWGSDDFGPIGYSAGNAGPTYVAAGEWAHVAGTLTGGVLRVYYAGVLRDTQDLGASFVRAHHTAPLLLGSAYEGLVDDVRLSNEARSVAGIMAVPTAALVADALTVALYRFDDPPGASIADASSAMVPGSLGPGAQAPERVSAPCASVR